MKRKKSAGQKKRVAYVLSPDTPASHIHSASISLEMSSVPKSEEFTQPQVDGQGRANSSSKRHHNTDNFSVGSTEGDLSVNSGNKK